LKPGSAHRGQTAKMKTWMKTWHSGVPDMGSSSSNDDTMFMQMVDLYSHIKIALSQVLEEQEQATAEVLLRKQAHGPAESYFGTDNTGRSEIKIMVFQWAGQAIINILD